MIVRPAVPIWALWWALKECFGIESFAPRAAAVSGMIRGGLLVEVPLDTPGFALYRAPEIAKVGEALATAAAAAELVARARGWCELTGYAVAHLVVALGLAELYPPSARDPSAPERCRHQRRLFECPACIEAINEADDQYWVGVAAFAADDPYR